MAGVTSAKKQEKFRGVMAKDQDCSLNVSEFET